MRIFPQSRFQKPSGKLRDSLVIHEHADSDTGKTLVLFVHGLGGKRYETWGKLPEFLFEDHPEIDVGLYGYRSLWGRWIPGKSISFEDEARLLAEAIRNAQDKRILLIAHSMGGLLAKGAIKYLIDIGLASVLSRIDGLILMASPQAGSKRVLGLASFFSEDARILETHSDYAQRVDRVFVDHLDVTVGRSRPSCQHLRTWAVQAANDHWVDKMSSGLGIPSDQCCLALESHTSLVKPEDKHEVTYRFVQRCLVECLESTTQQNNFLPTSLGGLLESAPVQFSPTPGGALCRVEAGLHDSTSGKNLVFDVAFFPFVLSPEDQPELAISCGFRMATTEAVLEGVVATQDPQVTHEPVQGEVVVEFGVGTSPRIRFEGDSEGLLEGRSRLEFPAKAESGICRARVSVEANVVGTSAKLGLEARSALEVVLRAFLTERIGDQLTQSFEFEWTT